MKMLEISSIQTAWLPWRIAVRQEPPSGQQAGSRPYKEPSKDATQSLKPTDPTHYKQNAL